MSGNNKQKEVDSNVLFVSLEGRNRRDDHRHYHLQNKHQQSFYFNPQLVISLFTIHLKYSISHLVVQTTTLVGTSFEFPSRCGMSWVTQCDPFYPTDIRCLHKTYFQYYLFFYLCFPGGTSASGSKKSRGDTTHHRRENKVFPTC